MSIRDVVELDQSIWKYRWTRRVSDNTKVGSVAGTVNSHGYCVIVHKARHYRVHRLVWEELRGPIPEGMEVDHIDGNRSNNHINNLRLADQSQQMYNKRIGKTLSVTGIKGVTVFHNRKRSTVFYRVCIKHYKKRHQKYFPFSSDGLQAATEYCRTMREQLHGEYANHG